MFVSEEWCACVSVCVVRVGGGSEIITFSSFSDAAAGGGGSVGSA